jgi:hypothetical protein
VRNLACTSGMVRRPAAFIKEEARRWGEIINSNNIVVD